MTSSIWIIDHNYADFALARKFLTECNHEPEHILWINGINEIPRNPPPVLVFVAADMAVEILQKLPWFIEMTARLPLILIADDDTPVTLQLASSINARDYLVKKEITLPLFRKCIQYAIRRSSEINELQRSKDDYMRIFRQNPVPMWIYDVNNLSFLAVNNAAIDQYGYSEQEFLAMTIKDIRPLEDIAKLMSILTHGNKSSYHDNNYWTHVKKNGERLKVHVYSSDIKFGNNKACKLVTAINIDREFHLTNKLIALGLL